MVSFMIQGALIFACERKTPFAGNRLENSRWN